MKKVLLSSGGMDSYLLAHEPELAGAVHLFVDVGQAYAIKEELSAMRVAESVATKLVRMKTLGMSAYEHSSGIIPFRNAELALCAAQLGEAIYLGVIADEVNSDKSQEFMEAMATVLNISHRKQYWTQGRQFELRTPFRHYSKTQLVERYIERGGDLKKLYQTVSCYSGGKEHCGRCSSCFKRWVALTVATGCDHGAQFREHPVSWHPAYHWTNKAREQDWSARRIADIVTAYSIAEHA